MISVLRCAHPYGMYCENRILRVCSGINWLIWPEYFLHFFFWLNSPSGFTTCCKFQFQYFVESGAMAVRRVKKSDLKRIAKATGASYLTSLTNMEGKSFLLKPRITFSVCQRILLTLSCIVHFDISFEMIDFLTF